MKMTYQLSDLNCWWNACAQDGFRQEVLFTFVKDTLSFLNIDSGFPLGAQTESHSLRPSA